MEVNPVCEKCDTVMLPLMCMDGGKPVCCFDRTASAGKINFKCPDCGRSVDVPHMHQVQYWREWAMEKCEEKSRRGTCGKPATSVVVFADYKRRLVCSRHRLAVEKGEYWQILHLPSKRDRVIK